MPGTVVDLRAVTHPDTDSISAHLDHCRLRNLRPNTLRARRWYLRHTEELLGLPLLDATPDDLERWQRTLRGQAVKSQIVALSHVRSFYKWAVQTRILTVDPSIGLVRPRTPRMLPHPIDEADLALAVASADPTVRVILILAAWCGLRACEIAGLTTDAVHGDAVPPFLEVRDGKGGHQRMVPLPRQVYDELRIYGLRRGPVVRRRDGSGLAMSPAAVSVAANAHLHSLGIPDTCHRLRHRYGSELYRVSKDLRLVMRVMGHQTTDSVAGYVATSEASATAAAEALGESLGTPYRQAA